jgi:hypothetical protein
MITTKVRNRKGKKKTKMKEKKMTRIDQCP